MADTITTPDAKSAPNNPKAYEDVTNIERVLSTGTTDDLEKDHADYNRMDKEIAQYANQSAIAISPEEDARLKKLIDRRVLVCMIITYFLYANRWVDGCLRHSRGRHVVSKTFRTPPYCSQISADPYTCCF